MKLKIRDNTKELLIVGAGVAFIIWLLLIIVAAFTAIILSI